MGSPVTAAPLVMYDGRVGKTITASMIMLADRPFNITTGTSTETYWLCTLTDVRYFWYLKRGVVTEPSSWSNLFSQLGTLLGTSITVDTIASGYGTPSSKWASYYDSPGALLDAAAYQVGQRVVVGLDGSVRTVNWETAGAASAAYFTAADAPISGGRVSQAGIVACAPSSVNVVFGDESGTTPHVVNKTLVSLAVTGYGAATGITGYHATVFGDGTYDGTNTSALASFATAAATDWYGWNLSDPDVAWPGIEPWVPTGWEERCEWTITVRDDGPFALTTVRRGPWTEFYAGNFINNPPDATLTVEQVDGDPPVLDTVTLKFDQDDGFVVTEEAPGVARIDFVPATAWVGCGLYVDGGVLKVNLTDVVQDGLYWDTELCVLGVNFGCGLTLIGDELAVDKDALVGLAIDTSLVASAGDCEIAFDKTITATVPITYVVGTPSLYMGDGYLTLSLTTQEITDRYNAAGVLVDREYGPEVPVDYAIDPCVFADCCDATPVEVSASIVEAGDAYRTVVILDGETVYFVVTGGSGTYTIDYNDGSDPDTGAGPFSHVFAIGSGLTLYYVRVTDDCGYTVIVPVYVTTASCTDCTNCDYGAPYAYVVEHTGGTGEFAAFNGLWMVPRIQSTGPPGTCVYTATLDDLEDPFYNTVVVGVSTNLEGARFDADSNGTYVFYEGDLTDTCCYSNPAIGPPTYGTGGTGTPASSIAVVTQGTCGCPVTLPGGCDYEYPGTIYGKFANGTGDCGCFSDATRFPMYWNGTVWSGVYTGCTGDITVTLTGTGSTTMTWTVTISGGGCTFTNPSASTSDCGTLPSTTSITASVCCAGATQLFFYETPT